MAQNNISNNYDEFEEIFNIVNRHSAENAQKSIQGNMSPIEYRPRKAKKKNGSKMAILAIVASATILSVGVSHTIDAYKNNAAEYKFNKTIAQAVTDNTYDTNVVLPNGAGYAWDYNTSDIAEDVLNNNKSVDIDTRIYGCYTNLRAYRQDHFMDVIMRRMHEKVTNEPEKYSLDEINACSFDNFSDYIASLGLTKEEYLEVFSKIYEAYAQQDTAGVQKMLTELKGGSR